MAIDCDPAEVLEAWLTQRGFELSSYYGHYGYFTSANKDKPVDAQGHVLGRILYRANGDRSIAADGLRKVANLLTQLGVPWEAKQNGQGYWYLVVPVTNALNGEVPPPAEAEQEAPQASA